MTFALSLLTAASTGIALFMYIPLYQRILTRRTTGDFSKPTQWMIVLMQAIHMVMAILLQAWFLVGIYTAHLLLTSITLALIYKFYGED